jgi:dTDP-4-dehydrorhamnose 3,5-epimerase
MNFIPLEISGAFGIIEQPKSDFRGTFIRTFDVNTQLGSFEINQSSLTHNPKSGTLRGMHYQAEPHAENKVVICVSGKVFDVILDLREDSVTFGKNCSFEIGPNSAYLGLFVPVGCAHGYLTLENDSTLVYFMDKNYSEEHSSGVLWNDQKFSIDWPSTPVLITERDANWPTTHNV